MKKLNDIKELVESKGFIFNKRKENSIYFFDIIILGEGIISQPTEKIITVREDTTRNNYLLYIETIIDTHYLFNKNVTKKSLNFQNLEEIYNYIKGMK